MVRHMFRRRSYGGAFGRFKRAHRSVNHWQLQSTATTAVEDIDPIVTGSDTPDDRGVDVPNGAIIHKIVVRAQPTTIAAGKYQCFLHKAPGGMTIANPIASWLGTTDPLTEDQILARRYQLGKVHTQLVVAGALIPPVFWCTWKSRRGFTIRDGDDVNIAVLQDSGGNVTFDYQIAVHYVT